MESGLFFDKRGSSAEGEDLMYPIVIFLVLNIIFFGILFAFIVKSASGALVYEEAYSKEVALVIDRAQPEMQILLDFVKPMEVANENNFPVEDIVSIEDNYVTVRLSEKGGYSFRYFSYYDIELSLSGNFLVIDILDESSSNQGLVLKEIDFFELEGKVMIDEDKKDVVEVVVTGTREFKVRTKEDLEKAIQLAQGSKFSSNCISYVDEIHKISTQEGIDPFLMMSLIMKESSCDPDKFNKDSDAVGFTQIIPKTFEGSCANKIKGISIIDDITGKDNVENNLLCGAKILNIKYGEFGNKNNQGNDNVYGGWTYNNDPGFKTSVDKCVKDFPRYGKYIGWEAALRGYNGWGCGKGADTGYVEKIGGLFDLLNKCLEDKECQL